MQSDKMERITAVVINWNGEEHLTECLTSLVEQDCESLEVMVVDCNSKDASRNLVRSQYPSVRLVELDWDCSPPYAINYGAQKAQGQYVAILNNDVRFPIDFFSTIAKHIDNRKTDHFVLQPVELDWDGNFLKVGHSDRWITRFLQGFVKTKIRVPFYPSTACCILPRQLLLDTPLNDHLFMYEDMEWGWRLHLKGVEYVSIYDAHFFHKYGGTLKLSKKSAFIVGRFLIATAYVCLGRLSFVWALPVVAADYLGLFVKYGMKRQGLTSPLLRGIGDFFKKYALFAADRRKTQAERIVSDVQMVRIMIGSHCFQKEARTQWEQRAKSRKTVSLPVSVA